MLNNAHQNGLFCAMLKNYDKAMELLHKAIAQDPFNDVIWQNCAAVCKMAGKDELAEQYTEMSAYIRRNTSNKLTTSDPVPTFPKDAKIAIEKYYEELEDNAKM